jgi:hypothetical protein
MPLSDSMKACRLSLALFVGLLLAGCEDRPPPAWPSPAPASIPSAAAPVVRADDGSAEKRAPSMQGVPTGALDIPEGGCPSREVDSSGACAAARALPVTLTEIPTKLHGLLPLPGGKVHNRSARDIFAVGSVPAAAGGGPWEIARIPAGASLGGDLQGGSSHTTMDVDWVSATPPAPDGRGGFTYGPLDIGVKIIDGGELTVVDRPGGGVRFWVTVEGSVGSTITTAGQMNGGSAIVYAPRR